LLLTGHFCIIGSQNFIPVICGRAEIHIFAKGNRARGCTDLPVNTVQQLVLSKVVNFPLLKLFLVMSFSSVSLALLDYPNVWQGLWHSHGAHLPKGPMLTVSAFWFMFLSSGIALLLGWAISRLWRFLEVLVFRIALKKSKKSLNQSQCAVLLVNTKAPLDAFFMSIQLMRPRGPRGTAAIIFCAASVILAATIAIPAMIALLPVYQQGILIPVYNMDPSQRGLFSRQIKLADTVLSLLDRGSLNSSLKSESQTAPIPFPAFFHSVVEECPAKAICHPAFPFTFSSNCTLHSSHFGLNIKSPFSFSVYETCYRPPQAVVAQMIPSTSPFFMVPAG